MDIDPNLKSMFFYDPTFIIIIPAIIITIYAQSKVHSTFAHYRGIPNGKELSGSEVAKHLLNFEGIHIPVEQHRGYLSDHYDPLSRRLRLSPEVFQGRSIASLAISAHEVGHAIQHARGYLPIKIRTFIFPITSITSSLAPFLILMGFLMNALALIKVGIIFFAFSVLFALVTLPVEFDASRRALLLIEKNGFIRTNSEREGAKRVLSSAALTYIAGALTAVLELLRLILIARSRR